MADKGATFTEYTSWDPAELITANEGNPSDVQTDESNMSGMDEDAGMVKALDYMDKWGFNDVVLHHSRSFTANIVMSMERL